MKFSIVTPAYNIERWIAETIESVLSQEGNFEIEYLIMEDGSKDRTAEIAKEYAERVQSGTYPIRCKGITMEVVVQENTGMYEAINRGFARATGDIYSWINADDLYMDGALKAAYTVFSTFPEISWLKGTSATIDENTNLLKPGVCRQYRHDWLQAGIYGQESYFIEQDSVFWTADLWKQSGPMPSHYRSAGDYWLWLQFARLTPLWSLHAPISSFRKREGQISKGVAKYKKEQWEARPKRSLQAHLARLFFSPQSRFGARWEPFFLWLYPILFMRSRSFEYIDIEHGIAVKKRGSTYVA